MREKMSMKILIIIVAIIVVLCAIFFIMVPPSMGRVTPILDEYGKEIPGSISEKTFLEVDGARIGMILLGENQNNPVLLVCGGGPDISQYLLEYMYPSALPRHFTVCYFDYRGKGRSFDGAVTPDSITTQRYLDDVAAIRNYLMDRFSQNKIYIMGHSFGSYIALNEVSRNPEYYEAYLAVSQNVNQYESECRAYTYMLTQYEQMNNEKMVEKFRTYPILESADYLHDYARSELRDKAMHELGVGTTRKMRSVITGIFLPSLRCKAYTITERLNIWKAKFGGQYTPLIKETNIFNAFESIPSIDIPIYFFAGKYDYTCCESLQREYYEYIDAPHKEYFLYEDVAHSPVYEDYHLTDKYLEKILEN